MKLSSFSFIVFTIVFQLAESKPTRVWSNFGPRQGTLGTPGIPGIAPWSGSGRLAGMMAGNWNNQVVPGTYNLGIYPGTPKFPGKTDMGAPFEVTNNPLGGTIYQIVPIGKPIPGPYNPVKTPPVGGMGLYPFAGVPQSGGMPQFPGMSQFAGLPQFAGMSQFAGLPQSGGMPQFPGMSQFAGLPQSAGVSPYAGLPQFPPGFGQQIPWPYSGMNEPVSPNVRPGPQKNVPRPNLWAWIASRQQPPQVPVYQIFVPFTNPPTQPTPVANPVTQATTKNPLAPVTTTTVSSNNTAPRTAQTGPKLAISCTYNSTTQSVLCSGFGNTVSCDANTVGLTNSSFSYFAIGAMPINGATPEDVRFPMFPYKADASSFLDSTVVDPNTEQSTTYSLFFSPLIADSGLKIQQPACWKQMMDTFTASVRAVFETNIESAFINVNYADGSSDSIVALASVTVA